MAYGFFTTPLELAVTIVAVFLVGLSKGGLGGMSLLGVPLMALVMSPITAAAILLPILVVMDIVSVAAWKNWVSWRILLLVLPAALGGIGLGWLTAEITSDAAVRLIVGLVSLAFVFRAVFGRNATKAIPGERPVAASFWGTLAGYTSFVAHAGSPPLQVYMLPLRLDPKIFTGTTVMFFAITNALKLVPYAALGGFGFQNLGRAAIMMPLAVASTWLGAWTVRRMDAAIFYPMTYISVAVVGAKLVWDGVVGL
ncbi:sulfite exporter TauE/SafE family protein [Agrobacterium arsenijevicii]|uniref:sulfite exporter TauE/SafE family protein n=1 Tax=Agrobacterium arsenijevicii TaxID=1585697 RepID=UPI0005D4080B